MCLIYIKQQKYDRIVKFCEEIVFNKDGKPDIVPENVKPFYRLALATFKLGDTTKARHWIEKVLALEPNNTEVEQTHLGQRLAS